MKRCFDIIKKFKEMDEFKEYEMTVFGVKEAVFEKSPYVVKIGVNLYEEPSIFIKKDKRMLKLNINQLNEEEKYFYEKVCIAMNEINKKYKDTLPVQKKQRGAYQISISNFVEYYEKDWTEPKEITYWHKIERYNEEIAEYCCHYVKEDNKWNFTLDKKSFIGENVEDEKLKKIMVEEYRLIQNKMEE